LLRDDAELTSNWEKSNWEILELNAKQISQFQNDLTLIINENSL